MNKQSLRKTWVIMLLLATLGLILGAVNPALAQCGERSSVCPARDLWLKAANLPS